MARKGKQSALPGMEERQIPELHNKAMEYVSVRDSRMELTEQEVPLKAELMEIMKKHKKQSYVCEGIEITIVPGEPTIKVKVHKAADADENTANTPAPETSESAVL